MFFFPLGLNSDSTEVLKFSSNVQKFQELGCKVIGVTNESPLAVRRWMEKDTESGGFGRVVGFPILSDKDLALSMSMGVARTCGLPARSVFIVDPTSFVRYSMIQRADISHSLPELLRLVAAIKKSDETGMATPAGWQSDETDLIPTDYTDKVAYYKRKYGNPSVISGSSSSTKTQTGSVDNTSAKTQESKLSSVSTTKQTGGQTQSASEDETYTTATEPRNPADSVQVAGVESVSTTKQSESQKSANKNEEKPESSTDSKKAKAVKNDDSVF